MQLSDLQLRIFGGDQLSCILTGRTSCVRLFYFLIKRYATPHICMCFYGSAVQALSGSDSERVNPLQQLAVAIPGRACTVEP